jgi:hypothetical protein
MPSFLGPSAVAPKVASEVHPQTTLEVSLRVAITTALPTVLHVGRRLAVRTGLQTSVRLGEQDVSLLTTKIDLQIAARKTLGQAFRTTF